MRVQIVLQIDYADGTHVDREVAASIALEGATCWAGSMAPCVNSVYGPRNIKQAAASFTQDGEKRKLLLRE